MKNEKYIMSFSTGSLFRNHSVQLAELYQDSKNWDLVKGKVLSSNILQARTMSTIERQTREIISRLKMLTSNELNLLINGCTQDQGYILWIALCRRSEFVREFAIEILRERFLSLKSDLEYEEFDYFFNQKSEWYPELESIKPATRNKLRQVLFRILREAELLSIDNHIIPAIFSPQILMAIPDDRRQDLMVFPAFDTDNNRRVL